MPLSWMAWTWPTALFFVFVFLAISSLGIWEYFSPGGGRRRGLLRVETTRGDRLFVSLLGSAFLHLAWLAFAGAPLWGALAVSVFFLLAVFRWA